MPSGRGDSKDKNKKKKSKEQLEKELNRKSSVAPMQPMTIELVKPKRKEKADWYQFPARIEYGAGVSKPAPFGVRMRVVRNEWQ